MSLADAVKALKLVKGDLDKHKALLQTKAEECEALRSQLQQATTAASFAPPPPPPYPGAAGNSAKVGLLGLEYEDVPRRAEDVNQIATLQEQVRTLEQQLLSAKNSFSQLRAGVDGEMGELRSRAAAADSLRREKEGMAMEIEVLRQSVQDMEAAAENAVS